MAGTLTAATAHTRSNIVLHTKQQHAVARAGAGQQEQSHSSCWWRRCNVSALHTTCVPRQLFGAKFKSLNRAYRMSSHPSCQLHHKTFDALQIPATCTLWQQSSRPLRGGGHPPAVAAAMRSTRLVHCLSAPLAQAVSTPQLGFRWSGSWHHLTAPAGPR